MKRGKRYERKVLDAAVKVAAKGGCAASGKRTTERWGRKEREGRADEEGGGEVCRRAETDAKRYIPNTRRGAGEDRGGTERGR